MPLRFLRNCIIKNKFRDVLKSLLKIIIHCLFLYAAFLQKKSDCFAYDLRVRMFYITVYSFNFSVTVSFKKMKAYFIFVSIFQSIFFVKLQIPETYNQAGEFNICAKNHKYGFAIVNQISGVTVRYY